MLVGYARTSTEETDREEQLQVLKQAGCQRIFADEISGHKFEQPGLSAALASMKPGDILIIWRLDRLGRSLKEVIQNVQDLQRQAIELRSIQDEIDTTLTIGQRQLYVFSALAQCEQSLISERTKVGLVTARARGRKGGRPKGLSRKAQHTAILAEQLYQEGLFSIREICEQLAISKGTLYNYLRHRGVEIGAQSRS